MTNDKLKERVKIWFSFYPMNDDREALEEIIKVLENRYSQQSTLPVKDTGQHPVESTGEVDEELTTWLDGEYISLGHAAGMCDPGDPEEVKHSEKLREQQRIIQRIKQLLRQGKDSKTVARGDLQELIYICGDIAGEELPFKEVIDWLKERGIEVVEK